MKEGILMKKALLLPLVSLFLLAGCSNVDSETGKSNGEGNIDCYKLKAGSDYYDYSFSHEQVRRFKSDAGKVIYTNAHGPIYDYDKKEKLIIYETRFHTKSETYYFEQEIGMVTVENNVYLNIDKRLIDLETKILPYQGNTEPIDFIPSAVYSIIKDNFYLDSQFDKCLETSLNGMERHSYVKYGDDATFVYTAKTFK